MKYIKQKNTQTGNPKSTYSRGDTHPTIKGLVYWKWVKRYHQERWILSQTLQKYKQQEAEHFQNHVKAKRKHLYHTNPEYKKAINDKNKESDAKLYIKRKSTKEGQELLKAKSLKWRQSSRGQANKRKHNFERRHKIKTTHLSEEEKGTCTALYEQCRRINKCLQLERIFGDAGIFVVDHITPLTKGGLHHPSNLQIVPWKWNNDKYNFNNNIWPNWHQLS